MCRPTDAITNDGDFADSKFSMQQLRLEIRGKIHNKIYFRFRDRYTSNTEPGAQDHLNRSTDYAYIGVEVSPKTQINLGKMAMDWGGFEFITGHVESLQFNDIITYGDNFLSGVGLNHQISANQSLGFQVLNARVDSFEKTFSGKIPEDIIETKLPLAAIANWRGKFFGGKFQTSYSYSFFQQPQRKDAYLLALGHQLQSGKLKLLYDFKYSHEALDRKGIITKIRGNSLDEDQINFTSVDVSYTEHWLRADYQISPQWSAAFTVMSSAARAKDLGLNPDYHKFRTAYTVIPTLFYTPFKEIKLKFFLAYVERWYEFSDFAEQNFKQENYHSGKISIGFMAPLWLL